jgi:1,4-alpha-glucan branching enzyme
LTKGAVALVLHAHLPYVRSAEPGSLEEDWFFQALVECYLPLLETLERAAQRPDCQPKLTMGLSPTLLTLLDAADLKQRFPTWLEQRQQLLPQADQALRDGADHLSANI